MNLNPILCAVLATLGEYLNVFTPLLGEIDVYLAVFSIDLHLAAHISAAHVPTVLDTPRLEPRLASHFDAKLGLDELHQLLCGYELAIGGMGLDGFQ